MGTKNGNRSSVNEGTLTSPAPPGGRQAGIAALGIKLPSLAMPVAELAGLRGADPEKYTRGLGCGEMALCSPGEGSIELAAGAAERALARWSGDRRRIGLLAVGTESAVDMSRPLSAWVADHLGLSGAVRSYEVKHACYGGTLALRQALEWKLSGAAGDRAALVIASDVALYEVADPGEPTQGAGAVAMVVDGPEIAAVEPATFSWSEPAFDFWRPVGESYPRVEGPLSLDCYQRAAERCFTALVGEGDAAEVLDRFAAVCFHVPFPKMVRKAVAHVGRSFGWEEEAIERFFERRVEPSLDWSRRCGNAYTASLWISVARALVGQPSGERIAAFSYGSGFGAELLTLVAGPAAEAGDWAEDVAVDLAARRYLDGAAYEALRGTVDGPHRAGPLRVVAAG